MCEADSLYPTIGIGFYCFMNTNNSTISIPSERLLPDTELRREQHARVSAVKSSILQATRQLMATRALGRPEEADQIFAELEVLFAVERREADVLAGMMSNNQSDS